MSGKKTKLVKCLVCDAVFEEGVKVCPVCGMGTEHFIPYEEKEESFHKNTEELFLILGNGAAGVSAAEAIRERNDTCSIVMASDEDYLSYARPMLTKSMIGENGREKLLLHPVSWYEEKQIFNLTGKRAEWIDTKAKEVCFADGIRLKYDNCIYALGSECFIPPIPGCDKPQVTAIRRIKDTEKIMRLLPNVSDAVVIGGGVLGLEAAWELKKAGLSVTVLELAPQLMGRQLDAEGGAFLKAVIEKTGIKTELNVKIEKIEGQENVTGVRLGDHTIIPAQLVVISAGVRANVSLAQEAGAAVKRAIVVNEHMETTVPGIYACGDCAEYEGVNYAVWTQAMEMGKTAGANAAGEKLSYFAKAPALTFRGMNTSLFALGDMGKNPELSYKVRRKENVSEGVYQAFYEADGKLVGAILIGDISQKAAILEKME